MASPYAVDPFQRGRVSVALTSPETRPPSTDLALSLLLIKALLAISVQLVKSALLSDSFRLTLHDSEDFGDELEGAAAAAATTPTAVSCLNAAFLLLAAVATLLVPSTLAAQGASSTRSDGVKGKSSVRQQGNAVRPESILVHGVATCLEWWTFWNAVQHLSAFK